jgi:hypothetical protein
LPERRLISNITAVALDGTVARCTQRLHCRRRKLVAWDSLGMPAQQAKAGAKPRPATP